MSNVELQQTIYLIANTMNIWVPPMMMVLAGLIIGLFHLVAIALRDGSG